jgi:glycosyltransferase involved in cell wall biosynthesis
VSLRISVVIPVYRGEQTLPTLLAELAEYVSPQTSPHGRSFHIHEVLLVWDRGPGRSDQTLRQLAEQYNWVKPVWLSRNFGQHAATLAGMTSSGGDWIVTMDEDGQQDPAFIGALLDTAYENTAQLVYGTPTNPPPHSAFRNAGSRFAKRLFAGSLADGGFAEFNSYRLILGEIGRSVAAYTGTGVYLDVALSWVVADVTTCPVVARSEGREATNYGLSKLAGHFGRLLVSSGTKPLFFVSWLGILFVLLGAAVSMWVAYQRITGELVIAGWASTFIALMLIGGAMLFSLGIIAQYVGAATNMSLGKPLYLVVRDPASTFDPVAADDPKTADKSD